MKKIEASELQNAFSDVFFSSLRWRKEKKRENEITLQFDYRSIYYVRTLQHLASVLHNYRVHIHTHTHTRNRWILETRTNKHLKEVRCFRFNVCSFSLLIRAAFFFMIIIVICSPFERCSIDFIHSLIHSFIRSLHSFIPFFLLLLLCMLFAIICCNCRAMHKSTLRLAHICRARPYTYMHVILVCALSAHHSRAQHNIRNVRALCAYVHRRKGEKNVLHSR